MAKKPEPEVPLEKLVKEVVFGSDAEVARLKDRIRVLRNQLESLRRRWRKVRPV